MDLEKEGLSVDLALRLQTSFHGTFLSENNDMDLEKAGLSVDLALRLQTSFHAHFCQRIMTWIWRKRDYQ